MSTDEADTRSPLATELAELAKALGNVHRITLLQQLAQGEYSVERLAELADLSIANTSQHLQQLRRGGLVQSRREGKHVYYSVSEAPVIEIVSALQRCVEYNIAQMRQLVLDSTYQKQTLEVITREELLCRMLDGCITLLDVRTEEEFSAGHLPGAIHIPLGELHQRLEELPAHQEIVAYCRGPYCLLSQDAVALLTANGLRALPLKDGFAPWKAAGLRVEAAV